MADLCPLPTLDIGTPSEGGSTATTCAEAAARASALPAHSTTKPCWEERARERYVSVRGCLPLGSGDQHTTHLCSPISSTHLQPAAREQHEVRWRAPSAVGPAFTSAAAAAAALPAGPSGITALTTAAAPRLSGGFNSLQPLQLAAVLLEQVAHEAVPGLLGKREDGEGLQ